MESLPADPEYLPFRLDWRSGRILFVRSSRALIDGTAFLDGRTPLSAGDGDDVIAPLDAVAASLGGKPRTARRFILHVGFCGSTALARACSLPGASLCLKEPQILVDLANWRAEPGIDLAHYEAVRTLVLDLLFRPFEQGEAVIVKPTNWTNSILPDMLATPDSGAVFVTLPARAFLEAALDGGQERLRFLGRLAIHFGRSDPGFARRCEDALAGVDALEAVLRLAALVHRFQTEQFSAVGATPANSLTFDQILDAPLEATRKALGTLGIKADAGPLAEHVDHALGRHSKGGSDAFSASAARGRRRTTAERYDPQISAALEWARPA